MDFSGLSGIASLALYQRYVVNESTQVAAAKTDPEVEAATAKFESVTISPTASALSKITSASDLLNNYSALQYVLTAFGLDSEMNAGGIIKDVLTQDPSSSSSLVNQLQDPRWTALAKAVSFYNGAEPLQNTSTVQSIESNYDQSDYEETLGKANDGLEEACYFTRNVASASTDIYSILGDKVLRDVVFTTLDIPPQESELSVEDQAALVQQKLGVPLSKFTDPSFVSSFTQRYLAAYDVANPPNSSAASYAADLLGTADASSDDGSLDSIIGGLSSSTI